MNDYQASFLLSLPGTAWKLFLIRRFECSFYTYIRANPDVSRSLHVGVYTCRDLPLDLAATQRIKCKNRFAFASMVTTAIKTEHSVTRVLPRVSSTKANTFFLSSMGCASLAPSLINTHGGWFQGAILQASISCRVVSQWVARLVLSTRCEVKVTTISGIYRGKMTVCRNLSQFTKGVILWSMKLSCGWDPIVLNDHTLERQFYG